MGMAWHEFRFYRDRTELSEEHQQEAGQTAADACGKR
jgi:hypothetical protein